MLKRINYKKVSVRWFISFVCCITITIIVTSSMLYKWYSNENVKEYSKMTEKVLQQIAGIMEMLDTNIKSTGFLMLKDLDIISLMSSSSIDYQIMGKINDKLINMILTNPIISSAYLVNKKANSIAGTPDTSSIDTETYHKLIYDLKSDRNKDAIVRVDTYKNILKKSDEADQEVISYVFYLNRESEEDASFLIININESTLMDTIINTNPIKGNRIIITDLSGKVLFSKEPGELLEEMGNEPYIKRIIESKEKNGYFIDNLNNKKENFLLTHVYSEKLGYHIISITPSKMVLSSSTALKLKTILFSFIIFFVGIGISILITRYFYSPLKKLMGKYINNFHEGNSSERGKCGNEFEIIDKYMERNTSRVLSLDNFVKISLPIIKLDFIKRILESRMEMDHGTREKLLEFGIHFTCEIYRVVLVILDKTSSNNNKNDQKHLELLKSNIGKAAESLIKPLCNFEIVSGIMDGSVIVILNYSKENTAVKKKIREICHELQQYAADNLKTSVSISIGEESEKIVSNSYLSACDHANYKVKYGEGALLYQEKIADEIRGYDLFPDVEEKALLKSIKSFSVEGMKQSISQMILVFYTYCYNDIYRAISHVHYSALQTIREMVKAGDIWVDLDFNTAYTELKECGSLTEIEKRMITFYERVIFELDKSINHNEGSHKQLIKLVLEFIDKNCCNPNMSLEFVAEYANMNDTYLGKVFKECTGMYFTEYINELRLEKAKKLLLSTMQNLNEISVAVGFNSASYFVTCFKKYSGMTPAKYRNINVGYENNL